MFLPKISSPNPPEQLLIVDQKNFSEWKPLNDTIMGGSSQASCTTTSKGLLLDGTLIEEDGGFVSCKSPFYKGRSKTNKQTLDLFYF